MSPTRRSVASTPSAPHAPGCSAKKACAISPANSRGCGNQYVRRLPRRRYDNESTANACAVSALSAPRLPPIWRVPPFGHSDGMRCGRSPTLRVDNNYEVDLDEQRQTFGVAFCERPNIALGSQKTNDQYATTQTVATRPSSERRGRQGATCDICAFV